MNRPSVQQFRMLIPPANSTAIEFSFNDRRIKLDLHNWGGAYSISFSLPSGNEWKVSRLLTGVKSSDDLCKIWETFLEHPEDYLDPNWYKKLQYQP